MAAAVAGWRVRDYNTYVPRLTSTNLPVYTCKTQATNTLEWAFCERSHVHVVGTVGTLLVVAAVAVVITALSSQAAIGRGSKPCWSKRRDFNPTRTSHQGAHLLQNRVEPSTSKWGEGKNRDLSRRSTGQSVRQPVCRYSLSKFVLRYNCLFPRFF